MNKPKHQVANDQPSHEKSAPQPATAGLAAIEKAANAAPQPPIKILTILENVLQQTTVGNLESQAALAYLLHKRCEERYLESLSNEAKSLSMVAPAVVAPTDQQQASVDPAQQDVKPDTAPSEEAQAPVVTNA